MKRNKYVKILLGIVTLAILAKLGTMAIAEPWIIEKAETAFNEKSKDYRIEIGKVHLFIIQSGIELKRIKIFSKLANGNKPGLSGEISSVKLKGINLPKALFKKEIDISEVIFSNSSLEGKVPPAKNAGPIVSPLNIRIGSILFTNTNLAIEKSSTAQSISVTDGTLKLFDFQIHKQDTLSPGMVRFDFEAREIKSVLADSMYSITASGINYSSASKTLALDSFFIHPNFTDYKFTSRYEYQKDRIEAVIGHINIRGFEAAEYLKSGRLISSYIEIGKMDLQVFVDQRKEFHHVIKPTFQEMIYRIPGFIRIDSIGVVNGNVVYTAHAKKATEPGSISFNEIHAKIYKITNDTLYKTVVGFLELKGDALFMKKSKFAVLLKARIFDPHDTFTLHGTLSGMEMNDLNPILEKNAFIYATSGKIDAMSFSFSANNTRATGNMTLLYHGLDIAVKNKQTDDTTAFAEKFISFIVNKSILDSNPAKGEKARVAMIDYQRDPEKFLFGYCFKSILSGIKSSLIKNPKTTLKMVTKVFN